MLTIRPMQKEDIDAVVEINRENFTTDAWSRSAFEREFSLNYSHKYVLELDGNVIGYFILWVIYDTATLMNFAIKKSYWGMGYGKKLLSFLVDSFKDKVSSISLDVRKSNIRAIRLYKSLGFKIINERPKYYSDGENAYQMILETLQKAYTGEH
ncbi:ribosomal protein S18-alanine N-acetyltransferase [Hydrogenobacter thermophilus]|uniref:ribosomal protein S18-alanine N-acetyltransferase n=1 Tax=Hydrogenobacter thermophilus TaxID=940 RepID=UPI0030F508AC